MVETWVDEKVVWMVDTKADLLADNSVYKKEFVRALHWAPTKVEVTVVQWVAWRAVWRAVATVELKDVLWVVRMVELLAVSTVDDSVDD